MANENGLALHMDSLTPGGLHKKQNIRRFTPELFNDENDHNPLVARPCLRCNGKGFYRVYDPPKGDVSCEECDRIGAFEDSEHYFESDATEIAVAVNDAGSVKCPCCEKRFPITSNQYWTGRRHSCGQKLRLEGENAMLCWTRRSG
jgi:hypothetical protein